MSKSSKKRHSLDALLKLFLAAVLLLALLKLALGNENFVKSSDQSGLSSSANLANCLNERGAMMYGNDTCEYCQVQKKMFGPDFVKINYVNCDFDEDQCAAKGIRYYPAWDINGQVHTGIQSFEALAMKAGCVLTPNKDINNSNQ